ncbi:hypothetical protein [Sphingopyxis witflariensis]|uniref:Uncharacterized protein n=1 Tax=Sphingopyxis witflariensis TaxID=173675 RepID=A0A246JE91_9SPHN|nr:hypothetical protein [Sphingopyxis witflariensis]OWQ90556.1 hypothetical protein CDQ91_20365 [Sphingopyxis witflariensis]
MMMMMNRIGLTMAAIVLVVPATALAQFGGLGKMVKGAAGLSSSDDGAPISMDDADAFLTGTVQSTKNVMIAAALLAGVVTEKDKAVSRKMQIEAIEKVQDPKELGAHTALLDSDINDIKQSDFTDKLQAEYNAGNSAKKAAISAAVFNLALGVVRNAKLAEQAPSMISGVSRNPELVRRAGQFKAAGSLLGTQAKGFASIASVMPKLLAVAKVKAPDAASTSKAVPFEGFF